MFQFIKDAHEMIQPKLEQVWRFSHSQSAVQLGARGDYADNLSARRSLFDGGVRCHILAILEIRGAENNGVLE